MKRYLPKSVLLALVFAAFSAFADDSNPGLERLRKSAELGSVDAQYELGVLYEFGFNLPDHKPAAYAWYSRAAAQGNATAAKRRDVVKAQLSNAELERAEALIKSVAPAPAESASASSAPTDTQR